MRRSSGQKKYDFTMSPELLRQRMSMNSNLRLVITLPLAHIQPNAYVQTGRRCLFWSPMESFGPSRYVLATVGYVVDDAQSIEIHATDGSLHSTKVVQHFERFLGIPWFRMGEQKDLSPVSLNQICLLEPPEIPLQYALPSVDYCRFNDPEYIGI